MQNPHLDLMIAEKEDALHAAIARASQQLPEVVPPVGGRVGLGDLDLEQLEVADEGREARCALSAAAADA